MRVAYKAWIGKWISAKVPDPRYISSQRTKRSVTACHWPLIFIWFWFKTTEICLSQFWRPESTIARLAVPYASQWHMGGRCFPAFSSCWFFQHPQHSLACRCIASISISHVSFWNYYCYYLTALCLCWGAQALPCCMRAFSSCSEQGLLSNCSAQASHGSGFSGREGARVSVVAALGL